MSKTLPRSISIAAIALSLAAAIGSAHASRAPAPAPSYPVQGVEMVAPGLYNVFTGSAIFRVEAADATDLAALTNMDALSENWFCQFFRPQGQTYFTAFNCHSKPR